MNTARCPLCLETKQKTVFSAPKYNINKCNNCSLAFLDPIPSNEFLKRFYSAKYFRKDESVYGYKNYQSMESSIKAESIRKIGLINKYVKLKTTVLDIGSGTGSFGVVAKKFGFQAEVLDISSWAIKMAKKFGLKGYVSDLSIKSLPKSSYDCVTAWDVVEHFANPLSQMRSLNSLVKPGGYLFITTPNIDSIDAKVLRKFWYGYKKIPEHILYFSPKSMELLAKKTGFKVEKIISWGFVRDLNFISDKLSLYNKFLGNASRMVVKSFNIGKTNIYLPFTDMFVVLQKIK